MEKKIVLGLTGLWAILSALNESGLLDILPFENEDLAKWVKWAVATMVVVLNAIPFTKKKSIGGGGIPKPKN